jgi:hypothetical protein
MSIKTAASFCKGNRQVRAKTKEVTEISSIKIVLTSKKLERNTIVHLPKGAKKLDGEEMRTILLNGHKTIPSNCMPNTSEVNVHTCFLKKVRIEGSGMTKASILDHGVGLTLAVISQVEVRCIIFVYDHVLGLRLCSLLLELFFLFILLIVHRGRVTAQVFKMLSRRN